MEDAAIVGELTLVSAIVEPIVRLDIEIEDVEVKADGVTDIADPSLVLVANGEERSVVGATVIAVPAMVLVEKWKESSVVGAMVIAVPSVVLVEKGRERNFVGAMVTAEPSLVLVPIGRNLFDEDGSVWKSPLVVDGRSIGEVVACLASMMIKRLPESPACATLTTNGLTGMICTGL